MLRFRLGRIPVEVHYSHLLIAALISWTYVEPLLGERGLAQPEGLPLLLAGVAVVFVSILAHELGHALVSLGFGYQPTVQLAWLGGNTRPNASGPIPWGKDVLLTIAGPMFGFALAALSYVAHKGLGSTGTLDFAFRLSLWVNASWSVLNLVPVLPLDGGRLSLVVLSRVFGRRGFFIAQGIGAAVALGLAWAMMQLLHWPTAALLFGIFGAQAVGLLVRALKRPSVDANDPAVPLLQQAGEHFRADRLDDARKLAAQVLEREPPPSPPVRARAHHVLGWVAIKEGQGRRALDHFSQVQGVPVEPQGLAAAFSLIGDDGRALPLWALAAQTSKNRTVLHEWAGTLLRLGRVDEAAKVPGVDLAAAYECAERVFFLRERYSEAAEMADKRVSIRPTAEAAYDAACAWARSGDRDRAVAMLERARALGFSDLDYAARDPDLANLHGLPAFERWRAADSAVR
jgi:Zn-dependent protease